MFVHSILEYAGLGLKTEVCAGSGNRLKAGKNNNGQVTLKYIYGVVTVGERGQIVIPKKARDQFNIKPGDKLIGHKKGYSHCESWHYERTCPKNLMRLW
jgi:hypothetical protein